MRVVNWDKWQKAKWKLVGLLCLSNLFFIGDLDAGDPSQGTGNWLLMFVHWVAIICLIWNIVGRDGELKRKSKW